MSLIQLILGKVVFDRFKHGFQVCSRLTQALEQVFSNFLRVDYALRHREMLDHVVNLFLELDLNCWFLSKLFGVWIFVGGKDLGSYVYLVEKILVESDQEDLLKIERRALKHGRYLVDLLLNCLDPVILSI